MSHRIKNLIGLLLISISIVALLFSCTPVQRSQRGCPMANRIGDR